MAQAINSEIIEDKTSRQDASYDDDALLKAIFIYKISKFVTWPEGARPSSLILCTLGHDKLVNAFSFVAENVAPKQALSLRSIDDKLSTDHCQLIYIAASERGSFRSLDIITHKNPILTISELAGFVQSGGIVELSDNNKKMQFDINLDAALANGLNISSGLLKLARYVKWETKK
ncbi:MAG: YfiR family protein [Gammaproteobacteria bacterium]|nr:YfiR family protein [Gammaproteobacteria bacterium]